MLITVVSLFVFFIIASLMHHFAKIHKLPYTILLFIVGLILAPIDVSLWLGLIDSIRLTPELLFLVFLPVLIFDAWYHISYTKLSKNYVPIWWLAIIGLSISIAVIWRWGTYLLWLLGYDVPIMVMLLLGVIISSTDPVAVLSIFKTLWVPKRLWLIFEWESLFNDGVAVALFMIIVEVMRKWVFETWDILTWWATFLMMVVWGVLLWTIFGVWFANIIKHIRNNQHAEITLTMVLAHVVFLIAEVITQYVEIGGINIEVSWVIATAYAAIIMWNFGKSKISPKVEVYMEKFRSFFAFVANSLVFLMMGTLVIYINIPLKIILIPILLGILVMLIGRMCSIYIPLWIYNKWRPKKHIPKRWQHLLVWWSLRWALWLMLVVMVPDDLEMAARWFEFSIKAFLIAMTIWAIMFSLIVQWLSLKPLIQKMNLNKLVSLEEFEQLESEILVYKAILNKINVMHEEYVLSSKYVDQLKTKYTNKIDESILEMTIFLQWLKKPKIFVEKAMSLHALGIEKQYLQEMFTYNEMPEAVFYERMAKINKQLSRVQEWKKQIKWWSGVGTDISPQRWDPVETLLYNLNEYRHTAHDNYVIARTKFIVTSKVIERLMELKSTDFGYDSSWLDSTIERYEIFHATSWKYIEKLMTKHEDLIASIDTILLNKWLMKTEEHLIADLYHKEMISQKIYSGFVAEIEKELERTYL